MLASARGGASLVSWTPVGSTSQVVNGATCTVNGYRGTRSMYVSGSGLVHRFEVRRDENASFDGVGSGLERSELQHPTTFPFDTDLWVSYAMQVELGLPITSSWAVMGQWHASPDGGDVPGSPPFAVEVLSDTRLHILTRADATDPLVSSPSGIERYNNTSFQRGRWYNFVHRLKFDKAAGTGLLQSWVDGTQVVNLSNLPLGYADVVGPYWKWGVYRSTANERLSVLFANMEVGTTSLSARVTTPLVITY